MSKMEIRDLDSMRRVMEEEDIRHCLLEYLMELIGEKNSKEDPAYGEDEH